jgi:hypothetical protein
MTIHRRTFLKQSLAASAAAALASRVSEASESPGSQRSYFELRCYHLKARTRLKADADPALLDGYLEHALLPALGRLGIHNVGAFSELEVDKESATSSPMDGSPVWVLIPYATLDSFIQVTATINADPTVQKDGATYLDVPRDSPAFERIDSWLLLAFAGQPTIHIPPFSREKTPTRIFEMRDYESHSELKALGKMAMFNAGEVELMQDLGMNPVFFGQALAGPNLPHLRYMTSGPDLATHLKNWTKFGPDPRWQTMKDLPQYADTVSRNTARFLTPRPYSQI